MDCRTYVRSTYDHIKTWVNVKKRLMAREGPTNKYCDKSNMIFATTHKPYKTVVKCSDKFDSKNQSENCNTSSNTNTDSVIDTFPFKNIRLRFKANRTTVRDRPGFRDKNNSKTIRKNSNTKWFADSLNGFDDQLTDKNRFSNSHTDEQDKLLNGCKNVEIALFDSDPVIQELSETYENMRIVKQGVITENKNGRSTNKLYNRISSTTSQQKADDDQLFSKHVTLSPNTDKTKTITKPHPHTDNKQMPIGVDRNATDSNHQLKADEVNNTPNNKKKTSTFIRRAQSIHEFFGRITVKKRKNTVCVDRKSNENRGSSESECKMVDKLITNDTNTPDSKSKHNNGVINTTMVRSTENYLTPNSRTSTSTGNISVVPTIKSNSANHSEKYTSTSVCSDDGGNINRRLNDSVASCVSENYWSNKLDNMRLDLRSNWQLRDRNNNKSSAVPHNGQILRSNTFTYGDYRLNVANDKSPRYNSPTHIDSLPGSNITQYDAENASHLREKRKVICKRHTFGDNKPIYVYQISEKPRVRDDDVDSGVISDDCNSGHKTTAIDRSKFNSPSPRSRLFRECNNMKSVDSVRSNTNSNEAKGNTFLVHAKPKSQNMKYSNVTRSATFQHAIPWQRMQNKHKNINFKNLKLSIKSPQHDESSENESYFHNDRRFKSRRSDFELSNTHNLTGNSLKLCSVDLYNKRQLCRQHAVTSASTELLHVSGILSHRNSTELTSGQVNSRVTSGITRSQSQYNKPSLQLERIRRLVNRDTVTFV